MMWPTTFCRVLVLASAVLVQRYVALAEPSSASPGACGVAYTNCENFLGIVRNKYPADYEQSLVFHSQIDGDFDGYAKFIRTGKIGDPDVPSHTVGMALACCLLVGTCREEFHSPTDEEEYLTADMATADTEVQLAWVINGLLQMSAMDIKDSGRSGKMAADVLVCHAPLLGEDPCGDAVATLLSRSIELGKATAVGNSARSALGMLYLRRYAGSKYQDPQSPAERCLNDHHHPEGNPADAELAAQTLHALKDSGSEEFAAHAREALQLLAMVEHQWAGRPGAPGASAAPPKKSNRKKNKKSKKRNKEDNTEL